MRTSSSCRILMLLAAGLSVWPAQASLTQYRAAVTNETSLISYYTFDGGNANDSKGSNNGTAAGTVTYATGIGNSADKALLLKGNGHVNLGPVPAFDFATGVGTVEAWVRADWTSSPGYNPAIFTARDGGSVSWSVHMNGTKNAAGLWNGSTYEPLSLPAPSTNWHHLAVVFNLDSGTGTSSFTLYWDGAPAGTTTQSIGASPDAPTEIGSSSVAGAERWIGAFDEVAFYSSALSADTIKAHYTSYLVGDPPVIQTQPVGGTYLPGVQLTLSVAAKGAQLSYQWYKDATALPGQTNATLVLNSLGTSNAGAYNAVVSNPAGHADSDTVQVALGSVPAKLVQYQAAVRAEPSLVSYYTFDDLSAKDSKGPNNGTPAGSVQYGDGIGGAAGKALVLDGSGHINLGQVSDFDFSYGKGTVEAWVRADWTNSLGYNPAVFADRDGAPVNWSIHMNDAKSALGLWNGSSYQPQPTPGTGTSWHHLAVTFDYDSSTDASTFTVYWDGQLAGSTSQGLGTAADSPTELGSSAAGGAEHWIGALDEVAFYSTPLSAAAIQAHYSTLVAGAAPNITVQPQGGQFFGGSPVNLTVGAQGLNLTYQWFKDGQAISGATSPTLSFTSLAKSDDGAYHARVTNGSGSQDSDDATITVITPDVSAYQAAVRAESSLISYYTFDTSDATDSKGANPGTLQGPITFAPGIGGGTDRAAIFDGTSYIDLGPVPAFDFASGQGTIEAWIRADWTTNPTYNPAIFADRDGGPVIWSVHMNSGKDGVGLWNGSTYQPLPLSNTATIWHHFAVVFDTDTTLNTPRFTTYWDGAPLGHTQQGLGTATGTPTLLGSSASADGAELWIGALDEVAFYSTGLSADQISKHYQALLALPAQNPALTVSRSANQITLTWPADASGYTLQFSPSLSPASWTAATGVVNHSLSINPSTGSGFYRLAKP